MIVPASDPSTDRTAVPPTAAELAGHSPERTAKREWWVEDLLLIVLLLVTAVAFRVARAPTPSQAFPGMMTLPASADKGDPPSMDEVWNLALTTGRGSPFYNYARDQFLPAVPAWTDLADAQPWWRVWTNMSGVTHPPLYVLTLRLWRSAFGSGDGVAVACSVLWSCVTMVFVYLAVRLAMGRWAAFWATAALAVSPVATYYALEMRSYALLTAESAIAVWLLVRLTLHGPRPRDVAGLCVTLMACMLTHYFAVVACLAAGLYALVIAGRRWPRVLMGGVITAAVYAVIWLPQALKQFHFVSEGLDYLSTERREPLWLLGLAVRMPYRLIAEQRNWPALWLSVGLCAVVMIGVSVVAVRRPGARPFVIWFTAVIGSLLVMDLIRQTQQLVFIRYAAAAQPAAAAFVPLMIAGLTQRRWAVHVGGVALCAIALIAQPRPIRMDAPTFTPAAIALAPLMEKDDALLIFGYFGEGKVEYTTDALILEFSHVPGLFPRDAAILYHRASPTLLAQLAGRRAWLLMLNEDVNPLAVVRGAKILKTAPFYTTTGDIKPLMAYRLVLPSSPASTTAPTP